MRFLGLAGSLPASEQTLWFPFAAPYKPSFGYCTQSGASSAGGIATGSATVSTNYTNLISSAHEGLGTLDNRSITASSQNTRILEQLAFRTPLTIHGTNEQDLNPRSCVVNTHVFVLVHEMMVMESRLSLEKIQLGS